MRTRHKFFKGANYYAVPLLHMHHYRMHAILSSFGDEETIRCTQDLCKALYGPDVFETHDRRWARHYSEKIMNSAESLGFIRRLPGYVRRRNKGEGRGRTREKAYCLTPLGAEILRRQNRHWAKCGVDPKDFRLVRSHAGTTEQDRKQETKQ